MEIADGGEAKFGVRECGGTGCVDVLENKYTRNVQVVLRTRSDDSEPAAVTMRISLKARVCTPARIGETDVSAGLVELDVSTFSRIVYKECASSTRNAK
jgi:hypothetical protein